MWFPPSTWHTGHHDTDRVALSGKGEGVQLGVNGGRQCVVAAPFLELCVVVQPRGVHKLFFFFLPNN